MFRRAGTNLHRELLCRGHDEGGDLGHAPRQVTYPSPAHSNVRAQRSVRGAGSVRVCGCMEGGVSLLDACTLPTYLGRSLSDTRTPAVSPVKCLPRPVLQAYREKDRGALWWPDSLSSIVREWFTSVRGGFGGHGGGAWHRLCGLHLVAASFGSSTRESKKD